ncbi:MAG: hypothetical protein ACOX5Z_02605 [Desulfobulbus sp.]|jgi:hypothetical protein
MKKQVIRGLNVIIFVLVCGVGVLALSHFRGQDEPGQPVEPLPSAQEQAAAPIPPPQSVPDAPVPPAAGPAQPLPPPPVAGSALPLSPPQVESAPPEESDAAEEAEIDPVLLAQAEAELAVNQQYEHKARASLPILSLQTNNPVWSLERQSRGRASSAAPANNPSQAASGRPEAAPDGGPFGPLQPPRGEIWLRIPPEKSGEFRDIMAKNARLYRQESNYTGPVTVTLWVGGRVLVRQRYEQPAPPDAASAGEQR